MTTPTKTNISDQKIIDLVKEHDMTIFEIFEKTDYTVKKAYPEVVALILSLGIAVQIATSYGKSEHVRAIKEKIIEIYADWIEVSNGKMPICDIEKDPDAFADAIIELKYRLGKKR